MLCSLYILQLMPYSFFFLVSIKQNALVKYQLTTLILYENHIVKYLEEPKHVLGLGLNSNLNKMLSKRKSKDRNLVMEIFI